MSQHDSSKNTTIKIAAKEASQRNSGGGADPGPGDLSAAPSIAPQLVDIPDAPTPSQLVVKSTSSKQTSTTNLPTLNEGRSGTGPSTKGSGPKSIIQASMNAAHASKSGPTLGPAASNSGAPREPTSSRPLSGVPNSNLGSGGPKSTASGAMKSTSGPRSGTGSPMPGSGGGPIPVSGSAPKSATGGGGSGGPRSATSPLTASTAMQADSGIVHDEDEEGEGELEHPDGEVSPTGSSSPAQATAVSHKSVSAAKSMQAKSPGASQSGIGGSSMMSDMKDSQTGSSHKGKKNKVTKFRYHKRIVVRTKGNANPSSIMEKVNKKAGNARITPSTIEELDPEELMRRAGIKGSKKTHWRVRLRQTKRLTKNGKTTTQTKVAYRDSEGNKRVKTSSSPFCKNCGKKLEECKCDSNSES